LTVRFIPRDWPVLQSPWLRPAILCGQHSLEIFCLGVFLAFAAHFVMVEFYGGTAMQVVMSMAGILIMIGTALVISWYKRVEGRGSGRRSGRRMPTLPEARHEKVDRPGASGRNGRDLVVQCGSARRIRRHVRRAGLFAVRRQPFEPRQRCGHQRQGTQNRRARRHIVDVAGAGWPQFRLPRALGSRTRAPVAGTLK
jgi:OpgC protein.